VPNVFNQNDLQRQTRQAADSMLSFANVMKNKAIKGAHAGAPDYNVMYVAGLTSMGPGDPNGLYVKDAYYNGIVYARTVYMNTPNGVQSTVLSVVNNGDALSVATDTWAYAISNDFIGDDVISISTAASGAQLPEGNDHWSHFSRYGVGGRINVIYGRKLA